MGDAIEYSINQWHKLIRYSEDNRLSIDNNRAEIAIKAFVIGRKSGYLATRPEVHKPALSCTAL